MTTQPLRKRLPALDPARAALLSRLLPLLDGHHAGDLRLSVAPGHAPHAVIVLASDAGSFEISPVIAADAVPTLVADDGAPDAVAAVAALAALEPLVAAVEHALRLALRPTGVGTATAAHWLRVEACDAEGIVRHVALLGIADDLRLPPAPAVAPAFAPRLRAPFRFLADGPALSPARVAALAVGDVVLLGGAVLQGTIDYGGTTRPAHFRPADATLTIQGPNPMSEAETPLDPDLRLPLTVEIGGGTATLGELSGLVAGSVVPLGITGATLPVTLSIGGGAVAHGELVAIGDAYGVLITRRLVD
ncbi:FliM/FliN family flagellar motor switch protein [Glacieibacterium frigidum]|uniref:Flagellar motor switch protein FliN-like C-terminal domain-containing protein n=1 Tax=Glacieibacterium frigidum TaxID=2593303 RepID=A0A552UGK1_9SPHN|nr:FliM/FliN family flagellar motor switch protein [Glacieibacterium frigidum]TRW17363.1 hypothetical protein FMM06_04095 [Glacieibacterium frigidum]